MTIEAATTPVSLADRITCKASCAISTSSSKSTATLLSVSGQTSEVAAQVKTDSFGQEVVINKKN